MEELGRQVAVVIGILLCCFIGPAIAFAFLVRRKRKVRAQRRAPVARELLRSAGESLRDQLDEAGDEVVMDLVLLQVIPLVLLTIYLAQILVRASANTLSNALIFICFALLFIAYGVRKLIKAGTHLDNLKAGFDAELAAGQELDQLMRQGAHVFHDFPAEAFNIDHVVVCTAGVFAVETKGFTKSQDGDARANATVEYDGVTLRFPTWTSNDPLAQAERQASWLAKWLTSAVGETVSVVPVLALPGWFVNQTGVGLTRVVSGRQLGRLLPSGATPTLSSQDVQRVAHQVEQRCRTVSPRYAEARKAGR